MSNNMKNTKVYIVNSIDELIKELQRIKMETPSVTLGYENPVSGTGINFEAGYHVVTTDIVTGEGDNKVEHPCVFLR